MANTTVRPKTSLTSSRGKRGELRREIWRYRKLYPLLIFGVAFFAVFAYAPMYGIQLAFKTYNIGKGITGSDWVGFANFTKLFARTEFWRAFSNTIIISLLKTVFSFPVPILLAILVNEISSRSLRRGLQIVFTLPHFLSWVTISGIMLNLLTGDGAINGIIRAAGGHGVEFLTNGYIFRGLLVFSDIWKESGWNSIIYMAAIAGIDQAQYESATIDGVNRWQKAWYITWPSIKGVAAVLLLLSLGNSMNGNFDQVFNMYNPTVSRQSEIIDTYIYNISFLQAADYGLSTAVGLFKGIINAFLLLTANIAVGKLNPESQIL